MSDRPKIDVMTDFRLPRDVVLLVDEASGSAMALIGGEVVTLDVPASAVRAYVHSRKPEAAPPGHPE